jgi:hypothetical protein
MEHSRSSKVIPKQYSYSFVRHLVTNSNVDCKAVETQSIMSWNASVKQRTKSVKAPYWLT